jgi:PAS domain S-box-containing protein
MKAGPVPENEAERILALHQFEILDTNQDQEFDEIVELASQLCETPISLITFIDEKRQWFKANYGLSGSETSREVAFCAHAINSKELMVVPDATKDERFYDNPFVANDPNIRFYAGIPLVTDDGFALGTLCVVDTKPRTLTPQQAFGLRVLGRNVMTLLKLRTTKRELNSIVTAMPANLFRFDKDNCYINSNVHDPTNILLDKKDFIGKKIEEVLPPKTAQLIEEKMDSVRRSGDLEMFEYSLNTASGISWFEARLFKADNEEVIAIVRNITKEKENEDEKIQSLQFIQTVSDNVPALISYWTTDLICTFLNKNHEKWLSKSKDEMLGMGMRELLDQGMFRRVEPFVNKVLGGEPQDFQLVTLSKSKKSLFIRVQFMPDFVQGSVRGFFTFITNITKIKLVEEAYRKEKEISESIINGLPGIFYLFDSKGKMQRWNKNFEIVSGYSSEEIAKMHPTDFIDKGEHAKYKSRMEAIFNEKLPGTEVLIINNDKKRLPYYVNSLVINYEDSVSVLGIGFDLTERKIAEEGLRKSEANLRAIYENSDIAFILLNENLEIVSFNQMAQLFAHRYLSKDLEENQHAHHFFPDRKDYIDLGFNGQASKQVKNYSEKADQPSWFYEQYMPVFEESGRVIGLVIAFSDVSILKKAEILIKGSEQRLKNIFDNVIGGIVEVDIHGNVKFINQSATKILEIEPRVIATTQSIFEFSRFFDVDENPILAEDFPVNKVLSRQVPVNSFELGVKTKDGIMKWLSLNTAPVFSNNGVLSGAICSFTDITENIESQAKLKKASSRLMLAKEMVGIGLWELDFDTRKVTWDEQMYRLSGIEPGTEITHELFLNQVHPDDVDEVKINIENFFRTHITVRDTYRLIRKDNGMVRHLSTSAMMIYNTKGKPTHAMGLNHDITDIIVQEQGLIKANRRAEEMKQIALRAAMNPHFLFNALNSIQFFITHNDRTNAINYLSKFSKLVRGILNSSMNKNTKLSTELELLRHYIEIEQIRFSNKFDFTIDLEEELDVETIQLPSLLLQPFVENAILHGLYNKEGIGLLKIFISHEKKTLTISIEDNGIGREAAAVLKSKNFPAHQSKGIHITKERMKLVDEGISVSSRIQDLYDNDKPAGTRVTIKIKGI